MKQALKKESRTFVSNPFLPSSTSFPAPLTTHDINLLFLLLEEPHQQHKEDPNHSTSSSTPSSTHHTSSMTEVDDQHKLIIPPEPSCHHTAATFDLCLKSKTRDQKDSSSPSHLPGATRKSVFDSKDHIMCYEEHKVDETQNRTKRQRSPFLHQQDDTFGYHPGIYSYKSGDIIDNDAHCDDSPKNKRQCLELDHDYAARKEKDAVPSESTLSDTTPYATSTSVSTVNRKSSSKSFNSSSRTGSIQDIKRLDSVSPSIPPPRASGGGVESSSRETVVLAEQIWKEEPAAPKGKKVDITNLENLEESSPLRTDLHCSSPRADCWHGGTVSSGDRNTSLFSRGTHVSLDPSISVKESQSSQNTFPSHNSGDRGESGTKCTTASDVSSSVHKGRLDYAQEGEEVTTNKMHLVATSSHKAPAVDSWQAFMDKHQEIDEPENSEQIQGEAVPSSYNWEDSAGSNTYPYHHTHERHGDEGPSAYQVNYSHPPRQHNQSPNPYFRENHHTSNSNKQQNNHSGKPTAPLNYYHSTATGNPTSNKYSHRQYRSNTIRPNYRNYPPQHPDNHSYANNPISRPGSRPNSGDHSCTTTNHSYPPVPPLNEAHYLNDNGELMYNSYYPSHQIATNAEGEGRQINHAGTTNREQEGADIHNVYAHHQYDHSQYYGRHANAILPNARTTSGSPSSLSSSFTNSQQKQLSEALQPYYNRHILALSTNDDENWLSEFLCFVRSQCVEVFSASRDDVASRMNSKKVLLGQVGIRCRFCAHLPHRERTGRSSSFPSSINRIYQSLTMMLRDHFTKCSAMPQQMNERYLCLKANASQGATDSKKYWIESAHTLGLIDTEDGIRFHHHTAGANTGVPSGDLDRSSL